MSRKFKKCLYFSIFLLTICKMMRERQQKIVEYVERVGIASYGDLAQTFDVSAFTIRRDVEYLAQSRLVVRIKGGAQRIETARQFRESRLPHRMQENLSLKEKIAAKAIEFIRPGDSIFLDGSSTIACLGRAIAKACHDITVVTNSVLITLELSEAPNSIRVIGLGGVFDPETFSFVGFGADTHAESFHIDKAFFSCTGLIPEEGTYENAAFNRNTKRLISRQADKVYLLIDSGKLGQRALNRVLRTDEIDVLITDKPLTEQQQKVLAANNVDMYPASKDKAVVDK